jgi:competence protein ComEC
VVVGTHPHEDHIGGLDTVISNFGVEKIYMPKASSNTRTFEDVLLAIQDKGLKVTTPDPGSSFSLGQAEFTILAPNSGSYSDENNYSIVLKMVYGNTSFLFTGDAEEIPEKEMLSAGYDLDADVLKVGHHGSSYSTSDKFLTSVSPKYSIISVGTGNQYGHPAQSTLDKLTAAGVEIYRTDESGTIIATTDGSTISFDKKSSPVKPNAPPVTPKSTSVAEATPKPNVVPTVVAPAPTEKNEVTVYITDSGSKYHRDGCQYLKKSKTPISLEDAKKSYGPCSKCNPPQ